MNHPEPNEWLAYLENELPAEAQQRLAEHLKQCTHCEAELAAWRWNIQTLRRWQWPQGQTPRRLVVPSLLKWGIAALLVLGLGFTLGKLSGPNEGKIVASVRDQLRQELRSDLLAAISASDLPPRTRFQQRLRTDLTTFVGETANVSETRLAAAVRQVRQDERRDLVALITQLQQQFAGELIALRKDLESLASTADARLQQTRWQLTQLAASSHGTEANP